MVAFDHAAALGVDAFECDVHLSRDGEPVVIHDDTLDRTTDATGPVRLMSAVELGRLDAGCRFSVDGGHPYRGLGIGVPTLRDLLTRHPTMAVVIELKHPGAAEAVLAVVREHAAEGRVVIGGFAPSGLEVVRREGGAIPTSASQEEVRSALRRSYLGLAPSRPGYRLLQVPWWHRGRRVASPRFVRSARRAGIPVQVWVIDEARDMRQLLDWGVAGLISDRPDIARDVVPPVRSPRT